MSQETARSWWGAAWVEKMQRLAESRRFEAGAKYARTGRVSPIEFHGRTLIAKVQGSQEQPYTVRITFDPFLPEQWTRLLAELRDHKKLAGQLLAGNLPLEIQTAFSKASLRFMPERYTDLHLECACPDWLKPCKHLVAVWLKFARDFDRDPCLLFELRGLKRDELFALLYDRPLAAIPEEKEELPDATIPVTPEALPADPDAYWSAPPLPAASPESPERLLLETDIFNDLESWYGLETHFRQIYDSVYDLATLVRS